MANNPLHVALLVLVAAASASAFLPACAGDDTGDDAGDESVAGGSAISGGLNIGTELVTTTNVNLRQGPSTSTAVLRTLAKGSTLTVVNRTTPEGAFYNVRAGDQIGWAHGAYLARKDGSTSAGSTTPATPGCVERRLQFSADSLPSLPRGAYVWGGNATGGDAFIDPPYSGAFLARAKAAHDAGLEVFAYLEGPCGDTGGVDDGERARCASIHRSYNQRFAPGAPDTAVARWKPYTMKQLTASGASNVDYCEIDNLANNVTIPLNPLLREIKGLYDRGAIHCRLVLKNVSASAIDSIRASVAATPAEAKFIAPFHIYEADDTSEKAALDAAMRRLKGPGAVTIISTDTNHYGSAFTPDPFQSCN